MIPFWLHLLSIIFLVLGFTICIAIAWDETRHPQHMWIMNTVWSITALFGTFVALWAYVRYGRLATHEAMSTGKGDDEKRPFQPWSAKQQAIVALDAR